MFKQLNRNMDLTEELQWNLVRERKSVFKIQWQRQHWPLRFLERKPFNWCRGQEIANQPGNTAREAVSLAQAKNNERQVIKEIKENDRKTEQPGCSCPRGRVWMWMRHWKEVAFERPTVSGLHYPGLMVLASLSSLLWEAEAGGSQVRDLPW